MSLAATNAPKVSSRVYFFILVEMKYITRAPPSPLERAEYEQAKKKQIILISHALVRGQTLPQRGDVGIDMTAGVLDEMRQANMNAAKPPMQVESNRPQAQFEQMISSVDYSELILQFVNVSDQKTLAFVSKTCREVIGSYRRTWDLGRMIFGLCDVDADNKASPSVEPNRVGAALWVNGGGPWDTKRHRHPLSVDTSNALDASYLNHPTASRDLFTSVWRSYYQGRPFSRGEKTYEDSSARAKENLNKVLARAVSHVKKLSKDHKTPNVYSCKFDRLQPMLVSFAQNGSHIRQVHLDNIPFFDVRLLAIVLEHLPALESMAVDSCELIHLGKLSTILDLLWSVGERRGGNFIDFDLFPKAWFGPTKKRTATSVLTFNPSVELETPRIVMASIIAAVMKAEAMDLNIIKPGGLLEKYLLLVPMELGLMSMFLRYLRQYAKLCRTPLSRRTPAQTRGINYNIRQILGCINETVSSQLFESMRVIDFDVGSMHKTLRKCSICKHKICKLLIQPCHWYGCANEEYVCSACMLTPIIEADDHAWLHEKREILDILLGEGPQKDDSVVRDEVPSNAVGGEEDDNDAETSPNHTQVCPVTANNFIYSPEYIEGDEDQWIAMMGDNLWYGKYADAANQTLHEDEAAWKAAREAVVWLDAKNRFAIDGLGAWLDDPERARQPYRHHSMSFRTWEGIYEQSVLRSSRDQVRDEADNMNWGRLKDISTGLKTYRHSARERRL